jgi:hypothetical protein
MGRGAPPADGPALDGKHIAEPVRDELKELALPRNAMNLVEKASRLRALDGRVGLRGAEGQRPREARVRPIVTPQGKVDEHDDVLWLEHTTSLFANRESRNLLF